MFTHEESTKNIYTETAKLPIFFIEKKHRETTGV